MIEMISSMEESIFKQILLFFQYIQPYLFYTISFIGLGIFFKPRWKVWVSYIALLGLRFVLANSIIGATVLIQSAEFWSLETLLLFIYAAVFFKGNLLYKASYAAGIFLISNLINASLYRLLGAITAQVGNVISYPLVESVIMPLSLLFMLFILFVISYFKEINFRMQESKWLERISMVFPLAFVIMMQSNYQSILMDDKQFALSFVATIIMILLALLFVRQTQIKQVLAEEKQRNMKIAIDTQKDYFQKLHESNQQARRQKHDMLHHLQVITQLNQASEQKKIIQYIDEITDKVHQTQAIVYSEEPLIDALFNQKMALAQEQNIEIDAIFDLVHEIKIDISDLAVVIGNALDNAIEALAKNTSPEQKIIKMKLKSTEHFIFLFIENPIEKVPPLKNGSLLSSKEDKENHGIGLSSIESIVKQYSGSFDLRYDNGFFVLQCSFAQSQGDIHV